jgi:hypothetical protein
MQTKKERVNEIKFRSREEYELKLNELLGFESRKYLDVY